MVIMVTQLSPSARLSRSVYKAISSRNPERLGSVPSAFSRYVRMLDFSSCTFSSRPRLSTSSFSRRAGAQPLRSQT